MTQMPPPRQAELTRHLEKSRAVQRRVVRAGLAGGGVAVVLWLAGQGLLALAVAALAATVAGTGAWITHGHIADFERQLGRRSPGR